VLQTGIHSKGLSDGVAGLPAARSLPEWFGHAPCPYHLRPETSCSFSQDELQLSHRIRHQLSLITWIRQSHTCMAPTNVFIMLGKLCQPHGCVGSRRLISPACTSFLETASKTRRWCSSRLRCSYWAFASQLLTSFCLQTPPNACCLPRQAMQHVLPAVVSIINSLGHLLVENGL